MIHQLPKIEQADRDVLGLIHAQRKQLRYLVDQNPVRWRGALRRNTFARAVQGSNSIEGYVTDLADAIAIIDDEIPDNVHEETRRALVGYRTALTYILSIHDDPEGKLNEQLIRSLHFMMLSYDMSKLPGKWRRRPVYVVSEASKDVVYEGPDPDLVPELMAELVAQLQSEASQDSMIIAAMAHLNLTMIHPFADGNGRMARALQTLLLTQDGVLSPIFCSIEEWLGRNTLAYYEILSRIGRGVWSPQNDALPWVRFCLRAHFQQAATLIRRNQDIAQVWEQVERLTAEFGLPQRAESALLDAAMGYRVRNNRYRQEASISEVVASRDLKRLCEIGLLLPVGEKRGRHYLATPMLQTARNRIIRAENEADPYEIVGVSIG